MTTTELVLGPFLGRVQFRLSPGIVVRMMDRFLILNTAVSDARWQATCETVSAVAIPEVA